MNATKLTKLATVPLGRTLLSRGASVELSLLTIMRCLERHRLCDWGDLCQEDREANDRALQNGERILSAYSEGTTKFYVITERDRSATTILLPEEY
jgi:hypothetical protein